LRTQAWQKPKRIPFQGFYSATKFALEGFSEALRLEVRPFGIRVVLIEPGDHRTAFTGKRCWAQAAVDETSAYRERCGRAVARMAADEQAGPGPEGIARLLHRVLNTPNPRLRYSAGPVAQRSAVWLKRGLPYAAIEKLMRDHYSG
jgi:NAD(P)-dependent dehydrogenase (short-subunit alcohol dehydrogenase family)